jgi:hypothetical protein
MQADAGHPDVSSTAARDTATPNPDGARPFDPALLDQPYDGADPSTALCNTLLNSAPLLEIDWTSAPFPDASTFAGGPLVDGTYEMIAIRIHRERPMGTEAIGRFMQRTISINDGVRRLDLVEKYSGGTSYQEVRGTETLALSGKTLTSARLCGQSGSNRYEYSIAADTLQFRFEVGQSIILYRRRP